MIHFKLWNSYFVGKSIMKIRKWKSFIFKFFEEIRNRKKIKGVHNKDEI
jgi:hypothetical protein